MIISLLAVTALAGALLGAVYTVTKEPIEKAAEKRQQDAIAEVTPQFTNNPQADAREFDVDGQTVTVYPAINGDKLVGAAVKAASMSGFSGEIVVMCGFEADGTVRDYRVLSQAETPGLGAKMEMWFRDPAGARSVIGKNPSVYSFYVVKDQASQGKVDGITAATISSRAFLSIMREAYVAYVAYVKERGLEVAPVLNDDITATPINK